MNLGGNGVLSRRQFAIQTALGVAGLRCFFPDSFAANSKPNSKVAGVQIGLNVPYSFSNMQMSAEDILNNCVQLGFSAVELRTQPVEVFLGAANALVNPPKNVPSDQAAANAKELAQWRKSVSPKGAKA